LIIYNGQGFGYAELRRLEVLFLNRETEMMNIREMIIFKVNDIIFSFPLEYVKEVVHMAELFTPPGTPACIDGFLNLEGKAIPVLSLAQLFFSNSPKKELYTPLIILKSPLERSTWALLVDSVLNLRNTSQENLLPVSEELVFNRCVSAVMEIDLGKVYILDPRKILLQQEEQTVMEFQKIAQRRIDNSQTKKRKQKKNG